MRVAFFVARKDHVADLPSKHVPQRLLIDHGHTKLLSLGEFAARILASNHKRGFA